MVRHPHARVDEDIFLDFRPELGQPTLRQTGFRPIGFDMVSTDQFRQEIKSRFELAGAQGRQDLTIECGELYRSVSKLPVFDPWMIFCCNAMRAEMAKTDRLVFDDNEASLLTIHYSLPRIEGRAPRSN
jgi:hypothetical protein